MGPICQYFEKPDLLSTTMDDQSCRQFTGCELDGQIVEPGIMITIEANTR